MESWPPKNGESSTTPQSTDVVTKGQTSSEEPSNRVIMLLGLDPNTTTGMISLQIIITLTINNNMTINNDN
ncbi:hypothetical protein Glove_262g38 [Diversispora epigaea]|uniref:Uncharacterized protein n=1 Tax=Diversispora epigaea TaxID=1348612 RepID=A0A397IBA4_9GLOM|nr:hypothetical protein Glove_262g38 [Diversispora epigaea]